MVHPGAHHILIVCGEVSADRYGAQLVHHLRLLIPDVHISAIGGTQLSQAADNFLAHIVGRNAIGFWEVYTAQTYYQKLLSSLETFLADSKPDLAIILDFQHIGAKVAHILKQHAIPIVTYITPNFWIWRDKKKATEIIAYSSRIITIYPEEYAFYQELSSKAEFVGHPLISLHPVCRTQERPRGGTCQILLLPGSRVQEIQRLLPVMLNTMTLLARAQTIAISLAVSDPAFESLVHHILAAHNYSGKVLVKTALTSDMIPEADLVFSATGTASLECVLYHRPVIVLGALSWVTYILARFVLQLKIPYVALPNLILHNRVVPEFVQHALRPKVIAATAESLLRQPLHIPEFQQIRSILTATPDPIASAAAIIRDQLLGSGKK